MDKIEINAHAAWEAGKLHQALRLLAQCAAHGSRTAMLDLGYFYDEGLGTAVDKRQALRWYKRAYRRGSAAAAGNIAVLYRQQGRHNLAAQWFKRATKLKDGDAEVELAKLLLSDKGVRRSIESARVHLQSAINSTNITPAGKQEAQQLMATARNGL